MTTDLNLTAFAQQLADCDKLEVVYEDYDFGRKLWLVDWPNKMWFETVVPFMELKLAVDSFQMIRYNVRHLVEARAKELANTLIVRRYPGETQ